MVEREAPHALAEINLADAPHVSIPQSFTTLAWRVTVMTSNGYAEGEVHLATDAPSLPLRRHHSATSALEANRDLPAVERMLWSNRGIVRAEVVDDILVLSDLRIATEPDYPFRFAVAKHEGETWHATLPMDLTRLQARRLLKVLWWRLWHKEGEIPPQLEPP